MHKHFFYRERIHYTSLLLNEITIPLFNDITIKHINFVNMRTAALTNVRMSHTMLSAICSPAFAFILQRDLLEATRNLSEEYYSKI